MPEEIWNESKQQKCIRAMFAYGITSIIASFVIISNSTFHAPYLLLLIFGIIMLIGGCMGLRMKQKKAEPVVNNEEHYIPRRRFSGTQRDTAVPMIYHPNLPSGSAIRSYSRDVAAMGNNTTLRPSPTPSRSYNRDLEAMRDSNQPDSYSENGPVSNISKRCASQNHEIYVPSTPNYSGYSGENREHLVPAMIHRPSAPHYDLPNDLPPSYDEACASQQPPISTSPIPSAPPSPFPPSAHSPTNDTHLSPYAYHPVSSSSPD